MTMKLTGVFLIFFLVLTLMNAGIGMTGERIVGGQCEYSQYKGTAKITSITKVSGSAADRGERYEVKFSFVADREIREPFAQTKGKEFVLTLTNSSMPGAVFLGKYGIEAGKEFDAYLKAITKGTCTPVLFEFPGIKLDDYCDK